MVERRARGQLRVDNHDMLRAVKAIARRQERNAGGILKRSCCIIEGWLMEGEAGWVRLVGQGTSMRRLSFQARLRITSYGRTGHDMREHF